MAALQTGVIPKGPPGQLGNNAWTPTAAQLFSVDIGAVTPALALGNSQWFVSGQYMLVRSLDGGITWAPVPPNLVQTDVEPMTFPAPMSIDATEARASVQYNIVSLKVLAADMPYKVYTG